MASFDRRSLQRVYARIRNVKTWQLVLILIIGLLVSASLLRLNNLGMEQRRNAVYTADKKGDKTAIQTSLVDLQRYVSRHMNTNLLNGVYLQEQYNRALDNCDKNAQSSTNPNAAVYQQASIECRARWQGGVASFRNDYVACVAERVKALGVADDPTNVSARPDPEQYHYNFVSPFWSPDLAGFSVLFCGIILSVIALRVFTAAILRFILRHRFKTL